ncbi:cytochrome P450 [Actinoplanes sp. NPDC023801]|uniref:cytochrome P450 n=1 Tax=Actinoplanes sp. NPDC023801 TaxID=3154595 RepID=UPI0033D61820
MTSGTRLLFDLRDPELHEDRYGYYKRVRDIEPVHQSPLGYWVITRYEDCDTLLRAPGVSTDYTDNPHWARVRGGPDSPVVRSARRWMLTRAGADHRRLRRMVSRALTPAAMARLRPRIRTLVNEMIDAMGEGEADLISGLALPLPVVVVCELVGIPPEDADRCRKWTNTIADVVDPLVTPRMRRQMNEAVPEFSAYIAGLLAQRRAEPRDDLMSILLEPDAKGDRLSDEDIAAQILVLFNAGHETSVNVIGNGMVSLLENPAQLALLRANPELVESSFDELSRYNSAVQILARHTTAPVQLRDTTIPAGATVFIVLGAAHHDPEKYPDPERFDVTRTGTAPLIFGSGPHYCIAATLGRMEVVIAIEELLRRYSDIELAATDLSWYSHFTFLLGLRELPLRLTYAR